MKNLIKISQKLKNINKHLYVIGGYNRDKFLNLKYLGDIDLTTDANPEEIKKVLNVIKDGGQKYGTLVISEGDEKFEITSFRKDIGILDNRRPVNVEFTDNLELDSMRRDFTFNAIYFDVENNNYVDPQNGIKDLGKKTIRFIGNPEERIVEDALRILRFIRFKNEYNLKIGNKNYFEILKNNVSLLKNISIERVRDEMDKILLLENNIQALEDLKEINFFKTFLPEIEALELTPGGESYHLEGNVWVHTLMTIKELNKFFFEGDKLYNININFSKREKIDFYWTLLLHDTGKFETFSKDENGKIHYYNHETNSIQKTEKILERLKFSNNSVKKIVWLIGNHMKVFKILDMKKFKSRKLMMHKYFKDLIIIGICDHKGRIPASEDLIFTLLKFYNDFLEILKTKKFLTGNDILKKYPNLKGAEIKKKLNNLNDEILIK